ncbi:MAG: SLC13 family permease [Defluviitaleaceae bacterium]|nr:SLC13 family permease [Defluviitaleaceae bacterium]MCL2262644.1 SLC13 family permease [Defluviitaleaceae bacterium]
MISEMQLVFLILAATTVCFAIPKFRSDLVALCSLLALYLAGVITVSEALAGFSSTVVVMLAVLFVVGEGISQTGLAGKAGNLLVKLTGDSEFRMLVFVKLLVAVIGSFISNTGTVAILMPIVVSLSIKMNIHPGKLLMPLAFGASMGGALTLIGTAPNLLARDALINHGFEGLSFFDFTPIGLVILVTGTAYMWFVGRKLLDKPYEKKSNVADTVNVSELLRQYKIDENLNCVQIPAEHELVGKTLKELKWGSGYGVTVLKVRKKTAKGILSGSGFSQVLASPSYILEAEDILLLYAPPSSLQKLLSETALEIIRCESVEGLQIQDVNIAEVILTPQSNLINRSLRDINFRDKFGLSVLSVRCRNQGAKLPDAQEKFNYGDAMLIYGKWKDIDLLAQEKSDLVVISHQATETAFNPVRAIMAGAVLLAMVVLLVFEWIPAVISVAIAGLFMILTGSVRSTEQAYRAVNWQIVILIACMLPMATALENTGGVAFIADNITAALGGAGPIAVMIGLYVTTSVFGVFISNTATAVLFLPVAILAAQYMGISPLPFVMAVTYASSMSFATPVSTPPNAMVMVAGKYKFLDYMKVGIPLQILVGVVIILLLPLFFPFGI